MRLLTELLGVEPVSQPTFVPPETARAVRRRVVIVGLALQQAVSPTWVPYG